MRQRLLKSLRIAVTTVSLLVCGLLSVLWVRSYYHQEVLSGPLINVYINSVNVGMASFDGVFEFGIWLYQIDRFGWELLEINDGMTAAVVGEERWLLGPNKLNAPFNPIVNVRAPHWFWLTIFATLAALPWIKWRFSLRTLLIVMTLLSLFFGAIAISL